MYSIVNKLILSHDVKRIDILAEPLAARVRPGQFVMVIAEEGGEWLPLTVIDADTRRGIITLIFQEVGEATRLLGALAIKDTVFSILGPLGNPAHVEKFGQVVCVATGLGTAQILPICRAYREQGNKVIGIIGAKTKRSLLLEPQMRLACHKLLIATNDGSYERRGFAAQLVEKFLQSETVNLVYAIGAVEMMQDVCRLTQAKGIKTYVQVNPLMLCGTGVCGSCRVKVGTQMVAACQEGPEFDGHQVDFENLKIRTEALKNQRLLSPSPDFSGGRSWKEMWQEFLGKT